MFKVVRGTSRIEEDKREKEPKNIEFEWNNERHNFYESTSLDEEVEQQNTVNKRSGQTKKQHERYIPPYLFSMFALIATEDDHRSVKEVIDSTAGKLQKNDMEEEMESLKKNETWDLVVFGF